MTNRRNSSESPDLLPIRSVLIVDDNLQTREALTYSLKRSGYSALLAEDQTSALRLLLDRDHVIAALVDEKLGTDEVGGRGVLDAIVEKYPHIPVIIYTAHEPRDIDDALRRGAFWYVNKLNLSTEQLGMILASAAKTCELTQRFSVVEDDRNRIRDILNCFPEKVIVRDPEGKIIYQNRENGEENSPIEPCTERCSNRLRLDVCPTAECVCNLVLTTKRAQTRIYGPGEVHGHPNSSRLISAAPIVTKDGDVRYIVQLIRDVTREMELQRLIAEIGLLDGVDDSVESVILEKVANRLVDKIGFRHATAFLVEPHGTEAVLQIARGGRADVHDGERWSPLCFESDREEAVSDVARRLSNCRQPQSFRDSELRGFVGRVLSEMAGNDGQTTARRMWIPIHRENRLIGGIMVDKIGDKNETLSWHDTYIADMLARPLSQLMVNLKFVRQRVEKEQNDATWFRDFEHLLISSPTVDEALLNAMEQIKATFHNRSVQIHTFSADRKRLILKVATDHSDQCLLRSEGADASVGVNAIACSDSMDVFVTNARIDANSIAFWNKHPHLAAHCDVCRDHSGAIASLPYRYDGKVQGTLCITENEPQEFAHDEIEMIKKIRDSLTLCLATVAHVEVTEAVAIQAKMLADLNYMATGIAHEIRGPVFAISQAANVLRHPKDAAKASEALELVQKNADRIERIIATLLRYAPNQPQRGVLERIDVSEFVDDLLQLQHRMFEDNQIRVERDIAKNIPPGFVDRDALTMIFDNLLRNAFDATRTQDSPREIAISARHDPAQSMLELAIVDTGHGIPREMHGRVFQPFSTSRRPGGGFGLGLHLVWCILRTIDGSIDLHPNQPRGTKAMVRIPWPKIRQ